MAKLLFEDGGDGEREDVPSVAEVAVSAVDAVCFFLRLRSGFRGGALEMDEGKLEVTRWGW